jgi:hypothetical protein
MLWKKKCQGHQGGTKRDKEILSAPARFSACVCLMERGARVCERKGQSYYLNVFLSARDSFICVGRVCRVDWPFF